MCLHLCSPKYLKKVATPSALESLGPELRPDQNGAQTVNSTEGKKVPERDDTAVKSTNSL